MFKQCIYRLVFLILPCFFLGNSLVYGVTNDEKLVDPTRPINHATSYSGKQALQLNAILYAGNRKQVVINGKQVKEGSVLGNIRIVEVRKNDVIVSVNGERQVLRIHKPLRKNSNQIVRDKSADSDMNKEKQMVIR